jgi:YARHG domain
MRGAAIIVAIVFANCGPSFSQIAATQPQCYENVGCPHKDRITDAQARDLSCENLWLVRNTIYYQHGYCFLTERGRKAFSNGRCSSNSIADLELNPVEQANVATLRRIERRKGCQ